MEPLFNPDDLDLYVIGGYVNVSGEWAKQIANGEPIVLALGDPEDDDSIVGRGLEA